MTSTLPHTRERERYEKRDRETEKEKERERGPVLCFIHDAAGRSGI